MHVKINNSTMQVVLYTDNRVIVSYIYIIIENFAGNFKTGQKLNTMKCIIMTRCIGKSEVSCDAGQVEQLLCIKTVQPISDWLISTINP